MGVWARLSQGVWAMNARSAEAVGVDLNSSGSEAGSYLRLTDFVYHSTLGWIVITKKKKT